MPSDEAGGQAEEGWTPEQKGQGSPGNAGGGGDSGAAGEAKPKGRPGDDRAEMEEAAMKIEKEKSEGQPS